MTRMLLVGLGGLIGSVGRYWIGGLVQQAGGAEFPFGTLTVNVVGSFLVSLVMVLSLDRGAIGANVRLFLTVGFCGGFTTMSTFSYETMALLRDGEVGLALVNVASTLGGCFAAVWVGAKVGGV